jgi:predicted transcriptional regulator
MNESEERVFIALADTTRRLLLTTLALSSPKTAPQLTREFPITCQMIMKHLDLLARAGLVQVQMKGREKFYLFNPESLRIASAWIDTIGNQWDECLQCLKNFVEAE